MQVMDCVEVIAEKEEYAKEGVHKGMQGWICLEQSVPPYWLVNFPQYGEKDDIAEIDIKESDLKKIPVMHAIINEQIKAQFGDSDDNTIEDDALVEVITEKPEYAKEGVHKGMRGAVCQKVDSDGLWLVDFMLGEPDAKGLLIPIHQNDLQCVAMADSYLNKKIKEQFGD